MSACIFFSDKYIRLNFAEDPFQEILEGILKKGATQVYILVDDFNNLLHHYQKKMTSAVPDFDEIVSRELKLSENETMIMLAQSFMKKFGPTEEIVSMINSSNKAVNKIISSSKDLSHLLNQFRKNCSEEFFKISFTNYVCSLILNHFPRRTPQILEKLMLASTICDLSMSAEDFEDLNAFEFELTKLPEKVKNHPLAIVDLIKGEEKQVSIETITIIKQHHERPDGKGFPSGLDHSRINQLSAIFIIAQRFAERICATELGMVSYHEIAVALRDDYKGGFFSKSCKALVDEVSRIK